MTPPLQPLKGIKILDLSRLLPGPFCSYLLAQLGAQVTVIEHPTEREVLSFPAVRAGKKFLKLDLKSKEGVLKFNGLAKKSDVILEGFRPGVLERLGLGFRALRKLNPRVILCSLSGYGQKGGNQAGHDLNYLSLSGALSALLVGGKPSIPGLPMADLVGGMTGALRITAALSVPKKMRRAVHLDISILEANRQFLAPLSKEVAEQIKPVFSGGLARYHLYETQDRRWLAVAPLEEKFWMKFVRTLAIPSEVLQKGEGSTTTWLEERFREKTQKEWLEFLTDPDLCVTPVI